mmetsp:Transcript_14476/g.25947  ORF Transcript_14476/g.25947 Transcript_14476/m.25947 type:complete len:94 (-) Transcript_14476:485-766(-)
MKKLRRNYSLHTPHRIAVKRCATLVNPGATSPQVQTQLTLWLSVAIEGHVIEKPAHAYASKDMRAPPVNSSLASSTQMMTQRATVAGMGNALH